MKKHLALALVLVLSLFALMGMGGNSEEPKTLIGVVQTDQIYMQSKTAKQILDRLDKLQTAALGKLDAMQQELTAAQEAKDEAKEARLQVELQQKAYAMQALLEGEQQKLLKQIQDRVRKITDQCRAERGMTVVLEAATVVSHDPDANLTAEIVARLDQEAIDFGPLPSLEPEPEAKPEAEAKTSDATPAADKTDKAPAAPAPADKPAAK